MAAAIGTNAVAMNELLTGFSAEPIYRGVTKRQSNAFLLSVGCGELDSFILALRKLADNFFFTFSMGGNQISIKCYGQVVSGGSDKSAVEGKLSRGE